MIEDTLSKYLDMPEMRKALLAKFQVAHEENWQKQGTPEAVVTGMVDLVKDTPELLYVVLFNHEFLEELIFARGVPRERVMFMADCKSESDLSMGVYGVKTFELPQTCRDPKQAIELLVSKIEKAFYNGEAMPKTNNLVVFGNPPYQKDNKKEGGGTSHASPIYQLFVEAILDSANPRYLSFITPSRWMLGGRGLDSFRKRMIVDKHFRVIQHFVGSSSVFKDVEINGGVSYFLWDREHNGKCLFNGVHRHLDEYKEHDIILVDGEAASILDKVLDLHSGKDFMDKHCLPQTPFGLVSSWNNWCSPGDPGAVKCVGKGGSENWVNAGYSDNSGVLGKYKVYVSEANNGATKEDKDGKRRVLGGARVLPPKVLCTQSYMVLHCLDTMEEATNFAAYVETKFFRFMLGIRMPGQHVNTDKLGWVPDLGSYTEAPTDEQLFKQFGLSAGEIEYINRRIK